MESYKIILLIAIIVIYIYFNSNNVTYVSHKSGNISKTYLVRDVDDKHNAAEMLFKLEQSLKRLVSLLINDPTVKENKEMNRYIQKINEKISDIEIQESTADSKHTSYSVNKGELLVFCIRSKKNSEIHDYNDLLYVAIHEIAHIGCPEIGHTPLFFKINQFMIKKAIEYGIYNYVNYKMYNREFCGMDLTVSVADNR
jgi:hypothetical protein